MSPKSTETTKTRLKINGINRIQGIRQTFSNMIRKSVLDDSPTDR